MCNFRAAWHLDRGDFVAAARARAEFRGKLSGLCTAESDIDAAEIIFGELLTNALRYSTGDAAAELRCHGDRITLEVCDEGDCFDPASVAAGERLGDADGGRGLMIARGLAEEFAVSAAEGTCTVSARLPVACGGR
jgi:anti-sigma regulatory factor (Ser/Thr protein kinase)